MNADGITLVKFAEELGFELLPWQRKFLRRLEEKRRKAEIVIGMGNNRLQRLIGDSEVNTNKTMLIKALAAVQMSVRYYEAKGRKPSALGQLAVDIDECLIQGGKFKFSGAEMAMIADAANRAEGFYAATRTALHRSGEFLGLCKWAKGKTGDGLLLGAEFEEPKPEPKPPIVELGDFIEIRPAQPIGTGPNKTQGTKVFVRGLEVKGVSSIEIECRTNDIWRAKIECVVRPPEMIPAKVTGITQKGFGCDAVRAEIDITNLNSTVKEYATASPRIDTAERYYHTSERGPVTFKGQMHPAPTPLEMYQSTAAASARKALNVAMESLQKDGWKTPSLNYDELFTFIRDVTLNAR